MATGFRLRATYGMDQATIAALKALPFESTIRSLGSAIAQREPIQIPDLRE